MSVVDVCLPELVQLDWCTSGFSEAPWFGGLETQRQVRLVSKGPVSYVDPVASVMLAAWACHERSLGRPVTIHESIQSPYTYKIGLLSALAGRCGDVESATERILRITNLAVQSQIESLLVKIRHLLHVEHETSNAIIYCLSEFLRNVFEHSSSPCGAFVSAGYFPKASRVTIGVADLGVTVPAHVKRHYAKERGNEGDVTDEVALRLALEPRVSGSSDSNRNAGLGLYMTRRIANLTGGKFWILTGGLCARSDGDLDNPGGRGPVDVRAVSNRWNGTVAALTLNTNRLGSFRRALDSAQADIVEGAVVRALDIFKRKEVLPGSQVVQIAPDVSNIAQDKIRAQHIRQMIIMPVLREGKSLTLSFLGVALTTQSYMHALLAEPLRFLGLDNLQSRIHFQGCSSQVTVIIRMVIGYVLDGEAMPR
jgi:hypothetical protein